VHIEANSKSLNRRQMLQSLGATSLAACPSRLRGELVGAAAHQGWAGTLPARQPVPSPTAA
jgi:hypothetical protein